MESVGALTRGNCGKKGGRIKTQMNINAHVHKQTVGKSSGSKVMKLYRLTQY